MGDEMKLRIVFNVGNQFKEVEIDCDRNSTLASLYTDVIDHFGNEGKHTIDIKIGTWSNVRTSVLPVIILSTSVLKCNRSIAYFRR